MNIGERIKQRRKELGYTQEELAIKCGYKGKSSINKIEKSVNLPHLKIEVLSKALECDPSYLMGWSAIAADDVSLITQFAQLNDGNKQIVMNLIKSLLDIQFKS